MRNIALKIEYDGTDFVGSQWQNNGRSVQGELEGAWQQLTQEQRRIQLAGRTDAGVHARGQVANVRTETAHDLPTIQRGLTAILPEDVAVLEAWEVGPDFHARHTAIRRDYRFLIDNGPVASPLLRRHAVHVGGKLQAEAVHEAMQVLLGTHDFAAFAGAGQAGSTVRTCYMASCQVIAAWQQPLIAIDIAANAFLRHMVRNIVGTLLPVGGNRRGNDDLAAVLASRDRRRAGRTAPAHGLYLMSVSYP
ncbi:MAG TPA: tRNA pseudouridine(38-40) synthase TruA [Kouleothrix sp.]|uniref:tRNA pseudouridine(38-40) synthase TruA n=1 Tax=Kouleothrix sp. TaxID=2779161 RepID=UPI002BB2665D|nr:tRNA pseudouridine(38-40) synthase TruA [Kouleothrix sp.]HRC74570.1 tRNA pseudouridine(38-40) synthase TruA [Kouleothrix sp.]